MATPSIAPLVVIVGPTASGKSDLAMNCAQMFDGEIICADSRTVYRGMNIGTAKPTSKDMNAVKHHLVDIVEPGEYFGAADFKQRANKAIEEIFYRGHLPVMVGGTGLYVDSVLYDYQFGSPASASLRNHLNELTTDELYEYCLKNNVELPRNVQNRRHLIRAIEQGGINRKRSNRIRPKTIVVGIAPSKVILRERIAKRAEQMFKDGVVEETQTLASKYGWASEAMTGSIYRIVKRMIKGEITQVEAIALFITSDLQLAKRQMTWFRRNEDIYWSESPTELLETIANFVKEYSIEYGFDTMSKTDEGKVENG